MSDPDFLPTTQSRTIEIGGNTISLQDRLDRLIDDTLDLLTEASVEHVELDPLSSIIRRLKARGENVDLAEMPPLLAMIIQGLDDSG